MSDAFIGTLQPFAFSFAPRDWKLCDGSVLPAAQYSALASLLGRTWGGDGVNTVGIPDARGRTIIGQGPSTASGIAYAVGQTGGDAEVTLKEPNLPAHNHNLFATATNADSTVAKTTHILGKAGGLDEIGQDIIVNVYAPRDDKTKPLEGVSAVGGSVAVPVFQPSLTASLCICVNGQMPAARFA
jgi:microcystin-dependent protein